MLQYRGQTGLIRFITEGQTGFFPLLRVRPGSSLTGLHVHQEIPTGPLDGRFRLSFAIFSSTTRHHFLGAPHTLPAAKHARDAGAGAFFLFPFCALTSSVLCCRLPRSRRKLAELCGICHTTVCGVYVTRKGSTGILAYPRGRGRHSSCWDPHANPPWPSRKECCRFNHESMIVNRSNPPNMVWLCM